ncbi:hypothetical protein F7734_40090 [Scytonema sp. UIC 10036]|nr:hypothetical protein [Scytonema sp. UIC 10036]
MISQFQRKTARLSFSLCLSVSVATASTMSFLTATPSVQAQSSNQRPTVATVKSMVNGDISCYVTLVDAKEKKYQEVPATFEICDREKTFLNKKVRLTYTKERVNDCQSAEPCGKTRIATLISRMTIVR